jgi:carboxyl-terminal processing protease
VRISSFSKETASDFEKVLRDLEKEGLRGLILDLRWNQGGQLDVALRIVDMFIKEGVILRVRPGLYGGPAEGMRAEAEGTHPDYPMVILINEISASASEIVAGALADPKYKRAVLVGERTHGKGSVQSIEDRDLDGAEVKYTTAYYYLPSDQRVYSREEREKLGLKDWGVGPDVEVALRMDEVRAMVEAQRANDVLAQADRPATKEPIKRRTIQQFLEADPQLAIGLLVVKAELVQAGQPVQ